MMARCYGNDPKSYRYKGRGITVCVAWHDWPTFQNWALTNGYDTNLTIDRKDNAKGYDPKNCQWVTFQENRSKPHGPYKTIEEKRVTKERWLKETKEERNLKSREYNEKNKIRIIAQHKRKDRQKRSLPVDSLLDFRTKEGRKVKNS